MTKIKEVWKDIIGFEGFYKISNEGRIESADLFRPHRGGGKRLCKGRILKNINVHDYLYINLRKNGIGGRQAIHRLVAQHFIPNPNNKKTVNHINGIKSDNRVINLEWATQKENIHHAYKIGLTIQKHDKISGRFTKVNA